MTNPTERLAEIEARHRNCAPHIKERAAWKVFDELLMVVRDLMQQLTEKDAWKLDAKVWRLVAARVSLCPAGTDINHPETYQREQLKAVCQMVERAERAEAALLTAQAQVAAMREALAFAIDKVVSRSAGNVTDPYAYLWEGDWKRFEDMTHAALASTAHQPLLDRLEAAEAKVDELECALGDEEAAHADTLRLLGLRDAEIAELKAKVAALKEVAGWAQAILTALNAGDVASGSGLHMKYREVMNAYRESTRPTEPTP